MDTRIAEIREWAEDRFGQADLGDRRRSRVARRLAFGMALRSQGSLPEQARSPALLKASYRMFRSKRATFEALSRREWESTREEIGSARGDILLIQDWTYLDFTHHPATGGLGPIGDGGGRGFILHSMLAVEPRESERKRPRVIGMAHQRLYRRKPKRRNETRAQRRKRPRESQVWEQLVQDLGRKPRRAPGRWVHVADRQSDVFTFLSSCRASGGEFLIRLKEARCCALGHAAVGPATNLHELARALKAKGETSLELRKRPQRRARRARLLVSWAPVTVFPPAYRKHDGPLRCWVVRVREPDTPAGEEPIEWMLLTSLPVRSLGEALRVTRYYTHRWLIEEYHKCLKSGCAAEKRQLEEADRLAPLLAMLAVLAVRLLRLKGAVDDDPQGAAASQVPQLYLVLVVHALGLKRKPEQLTMHEYWRALARLGGFLGRRCDGEPGWLTLCRGMQQLDDMVRGARLALQAGISQADPEILDP